MLLFSVYASCPSICCLEKVVSDYIFSFCFNYNSAKNLRPSNVGEILPLTGCPDCFCDLCSVAQIILYFLFMFPRFSLSFFKSSFIHHFGVLLNYFSTFRFILFFSFAYILFPWLFICTSVLFCSLSHLNPF
jgi:hypothetical protein